MTNSLANPVTVPGQMWRSLSAPSSRRARMPKGMDAIWNATVGRMRLLVPRRGRIMQKAEAVVALEPEMDKLSDARLRERLLEMKTIFRLGRETPEQMTRALALIREIAYRTLDMKPYLEQVAAAIALEQGCVAEQATGEGKTLSATMPAVIAGWRGRGCHIITVNDYLAERDAREMSAVYKRCHVTCGFLTQDVEPPQRRVAYHADITYGTNKEIAADFLRDRLALGRMQRLTSALLSRIVDGRGAGTDRLLQRGLETAIIDEADSILVDEAVTPLIISGSAPNAEQVDAYRVGARMARQMIKERDYTLDVRYREVNLTRAGRERLDGLTGNLGGIWAGRRRREEIINQALTARELFHREKQYVIQEGKVVIVDEFTGRLMPDRSWRAGLHQAMEAKEDLEVQPPKDTLARVSFQRFFRLYRKLSGMTGTAWEARRELLDIYSLPTVVLPTHRPCIRVHAPDQIHATSIAKWDAIVDEIVRIHETGRPVLIGTRSVGASEQLSDRLRALGLVHQVLNAVRHAEEAAIIAQAGQRGRITVATNMAGRGTDIKLGHDVRILGGLHVLATERHESGRIDRQLFGRAGRQGDPGSAVAIVSLDDELMRRHTPRGAHRLIDKIQSDAGARAEHGPDIYDTPGYWKHKTISAFAQRRAEWMTLRQRKSVLRNDDWLDENLGFAGREM